MYMIIEMFYLSDALYRSPTLCCCRGMPYAAEGQQNKYLRMGLQLFYIGYNRLTGTVASQYNPA